MKLSIVITSWNTRELLARCLSSVERATAGIESEIIVFDNGSDDGSAELVARRFPRVDLVRNSANRGYAIATNQGAARARGEFLLLLGSDTEPDESALCKLTRFLEESTGHAGVAPRLVGSDGATQHACMRFPRLRTAFAFGTPLERWTPESPELRRYFVRDFDHDHDADVEQPPASCLLLRRSIWEQLGGFDEALWLFFNDVDFCKRLAQAGNKLRFLAGVTVKHVGGASTARFENFVPRWQSDRLRYYRKHHGALGVVCVKLAVTWAFTDWWVRTAWTRVRGQTAEPLTPTSRAFASFLFCA